MKHLLMVAIGCASVTTLITATPARSQNSEPLCQPFYTWVDAKSLPIKVDPKFIVNGKVKMINPNPCIGQPSPRGSKIERPSVDDYDTRLCNIKTRKCITIPVDPSMVPPGVLPRRRPAPQNPSPSPSTQSKKSYPSTSNQQTSRHIRPPKQSSTFDGIFQPNDLRIVKNTKNEPWSTRTKLYSFFPDGGLKECSGTLVGPQYVMTAAHCVWNVEIPGSSKPVLPIKVEVIPALNGTERPYSTFLIPNPSSGTSIANQGGFERTYNPQRPIPSFEFDIALVLLDGEVKKSLPGWLNYTVLTNPIGTRVTLAGYPNNTEGNPLRTQNTFLFTNSGKYVKRFNNPVFTYNRVYLHKIDGVSGMSGSSMTTNTVNTNQPSSNGDREVITGVFLGSSKISEGDSEYWNVAYVIDELTFNQLNTWKNLLRE